ncbi:uridylate-specific endoribonuclease-like [Macrobrachium rosenbergii]|uniref:uridylate-specific endoribonuclease-like n=1 Tax=Macrobrachium rosenbergii TaxID=79674 RepID=UPI0034D727CE
MKTACLLLLLAVGAYGQSCMGRCGDKDDTQPCQCSSTCEKFHDCCDDYHKVCYSCKGRCGEHFLHSKPCQCNDDCSSHGNCCKDFHDVCRGRVSDEELRELTEVLLSVDVNNVGLYIIVDHQGHGSSGDLASRPYFAHVPEEVLTRPTYAALINLQDNYNPDVSVAEVIEPGEVAEQEAFLDAIMATEVMAMAQSFIIENQLYHGSLRQKIKEIWFDLYPRGSNSAVGSSGFEHTFVGEIKHNEVAGFHNWVHFYLEEKRGNLDYEGWSKLVDLSDQGEIIENHFHWLHKPKAIGGMFTGTSPEFDIAVYTVCFLARADTNCPVQLNGHRFQVETWTMKYYGKELVGSAFPNI